MPITIQINTVEDGSPPTASINTPPPWTVTYTIGGVAGIGNVAALAYQIDDGAVTGIDIPGATGANTFQLNNGDLPANGLYLLTVIGWDDNSDSASDQIYIQLLFQPKTSCDTEGGGH